MNMRHRHQRWHRVQGTYHRYHFLFNLSNRKLDKYDDDASVSTFISSVTDIGPGGIVYEKSRHLSRSPVSRPYITGICAPAYTDDTPNSVIRQVKSWDSRGGRQQPRQSMPPLAAQAYTDNNADVSTLFADSRLLYVTASVRSETGRGVPSSPGHRVGDAERETQSGRQK